MKTLLEILTLSTDYLQQYDIHHARRQAEELLSDALGMQRIKLYQEFDRPLSESELTRCRHYLLRRGKGEPLQYIKGEIDFYNCKLFLDKSVLIPRQETEILVDILVKRLEKEELSGKCLWDVCCGSGCIGIALKKKFPSLKVFASDISEEALLVAKKNAEENQVEIQFYRGDLLTPFIGCRTHYFVCNPPYISESEFSGLEREVRDFEPRQALVSGATGLEMYQRLANELKFYLQSSAEAWFEIGNTQGAAVYDIFQKAGWKSCEVRKDWSGNDRFFFLENESLFS